MARSLFSQTIPRQHGAWSILVAALVLGSATAGSFGLETILFTASVIFAFTAQHTLELWLKLSPIDSRRRKLLPFILLYLLGAAAPTAVLLLRYERWGILTLALAALFLVGLSLMLSRRRRDRTVPGELLNVLCLSLALPAAAYSSAGSVTEATLGVWTLAAVFFGGSIFHVRFLVRARQATTGNLTTRIRAGWTSVAYHLGMLIVAQVLIRGGLLPELAVVTVLPAATKAIWTVLAGRTAPAAIRSIGYIELGHTVLFVALVLALALPRTA